MTLSEEVKSLAEGNSIAIKDVQLANKVKQILHKLNIYHSTSKMGGLFFFYFRDKESLKRVKALMA